MLNNTEVLSVLVLLFILLPLCCRMGRKLPMVPKVAPQMVETVAVISRYVVVVLVWLNCIVL